MENTKLQLGEILQLESEINGTINSQTGEIVTKGLLKEALKFKTKYWLTQLSEDLSKEKSKLEKFREELVKSLGEADENGNYQILIYTNEVKDENDNVISKDVNPKFLEFQTKYTELMSETKEVTHSKFLLEDFESIESSEVYPIFFKLISIG
jgi:hypothetical protein